MDHEDDDDAPDAASPEAQAAYRARYAEDEAPGWDAVTAAAERRYGPNTERHYGPLCGLHFAAGGTDPIDGASVYDAPGPPAHRHLISYGLSDLYYAPEHAERELSGWGYEFTMRIVPFPGDADRDPLWAVQIMNNLARYTYESGRWFEPYHWLPAGGPIRLSTDTRLTGLALVPDPELGTIDTPHGELQFLQLVGLTQAEVERLSADPTAEHVAEVVEGLRAGNPLLVTDLGRV